MRGGKPRIASRQQQVKNKLNHAYNSHLPPKKPYEPALNRRAHGPCFSFQQQGAEQGNDQPNR